MEGMQQAGLMTDVKDFKQAFALTVQVNLYKFDFETISYLSFKH